MRRREFITLLGSGALARPRAVRAQQPALPVFAFLRIGSPDASARHVAAFRKGLAKSERVPLTQDRYKTRYVSEVGSV